MRVLPFYFLFFASSALAQLNTGSGVLGDCKDVDLLNAITSGINELECQTLEITGTITTTDFLDRTLPLIIRVQNSVLLSATSRLELQGEDGATLIGGIGGPGAGDGGFNTFNGNFGAPNGGHAGQSGFCPDLDGLGDDSAEGGGGGGGALMAGALAGSNGFDFLDEGQIGMGGAAGDVPTFDLNNFLFAGAGGGGGGDGCQNNTNQDGAGGGGGGGGLQIIAGGDVVLAGLIDVSGGHGGSSSAYEGAGGGGSGGVIIIQTLGQLTITGTLDAREGAGGTSSRNASGGNGSQGLIFLQNLDGNISCPGCTITPSTSSLFPPAVSSSPKLSSDISCGTIAPVGKNKNSGVHQIMMGFILVWGLSLILKKTRSLKLFA